MDNKMILSILKLRKDLHEWYKKHNRVANLVLKGIGALLLFLSLNILYNNNGTIMLVMAIGLAVICAVLPMRFVYAASALLTAIHLWQVSWDMALLYVVIVFLSWLLICRVKPETAIIIAFAPLLFMIKIPFLLPLLVGMFSSMFGVGAMVFGVFFYFLGGHCGNAAALLSSAAAGESVMAVQSVMTGFAADSEFMLILCSFVIAAVVTYILYHQSFDYSWYIGCVAGGIAGLAAYLAAGIMFDIEHGNMAYILTIPVAMCIACILQFLRCIIDYSGVEYAEFEDDEYYYYVKAVPKVNVIIEDFALLGEEKNQAAKKEETTEEDK